MAEQDVRVWDPFVRLFHWSVVGSFAICYLTDDDVLVLHVWAGYLIGVMLALRVLWGFVGTRHARFADFVRPPRSVIAYLGEIASLHPTRHLGHNPAGGAMVVALMLALVLITVSGLVVYGSEERAGPLAGWLAGSAEWLREGAEETHEFLADFTLVLVALHVLGVIVGSVQHRENLVRAMISGVKRRED